MSSDESIRTIFVKKSCSIQIPSLISITDAKQLHSYSCSYCSKVFSSPSHLSRHILVHTGEKPCLCAECGQQFSQISSLERHQRTKHEQVKCLDRFHKQLFQCKRCHEYFSLKHNLKVHEKRLHQIQTDFFCDICSAYFTCNSSLQKHRRFRHRFLIKTQSENSNIQTETLSYDPSFTDINDSKDNGLLTNTNDANFHPSKDEPLLSTVNSNNLFDNNGTIANSMGVTNRNHFHRENKLICKQNHQINNDVFKWNEIN